MRRLSLYLFLVFVFTVPWQSAIAIGGSKTASSLVGIGALLAGVVTLFVEGKIAKPPMFVVALGFLVAWQLATYFWSLDPNLTLSRILTMVQLLAMVWLLSELCAGERERLQVIEAFVLGCVVVCLVLAQAYFSGQSMAGYRYAPAGFNPNEAADIIAAGIPMALLAAISFESTLVRWLNITYVPLGIFAVVLTASRSGFIATCLGLTSVFFAIRHAKSVYRVVWSVVILAVFAGLFFGLPVSEDLEKNIQRITFSAEEEELSTFTGRTAIWSAGLEAFVDHPWVGTGLYSFRAATQSTLGKERAPHNIWIETAVETGAVGLILLAIVWLSALVPAVRWRDLRTGFHVVLFAVLATTSLVANLITSKGLWIGLALLAVTSAIPKTRSILATGYRRSDTHLPMRGAAESS